MTSKPFAKKFHLQTLALAALCTATGAANAVLTVYTTQASFLAAVVAPGTDSFDSLALGNAGATLARSAGSYGYTASAIGSDASASSFLNIGSAADVWLSANNSDDVVRFSGFASSVRGIGGLFFGTDLNGAFLAGQSLSLTATDASGSVTRTIINAGTSSFLGFVSNGALTSLTVSSLAVSAGAGPAPFAWPTVNNLTLAVPEPQSYALMIAGLGIVGVMARRRRG